MTIDYNVSEIGSGWSIKNLMIDQPKIILTGCMQSSSIFREASSTSSNCEDYIIDGNSSAMYSLYDDNESKYLETVTSDLNCTVWLDDTTDLPTLITINTNSSNSGPNLA